MRRSRPSPQSDARSRFEDERGSASLEFLAAGVLFLVPLVYLVVTIGQIERAAFAAEGAARHAVRVLADRGVDAGRDYAQAMLAQTSADFGLDPSTVVTRIACRPDPVDCSIPGTVISVVVTTEIALPLVPDGLGVVLPLSVPVDASASARLSDFAAGR